MNLIAFRGHNLAVALTEFYAAALQTAVEDLKAAQTRIAELEAEVQALNASVPSAP